MIEFSECRVSWDGRYLYITTNIENPNYFTNVYIDKIFIDTQDTFTTAGPSNTPIKTYTSEGNQKSVSLTFEYRDLGLGLMKDKMLFIWVTTKGTPATNTLALCVAFNESLLFNKGLSLIRELSSTCKVPTNLENWALMISAFKLALDTGEYLTAIDLWNKLIKNSDLSSTTKICGCNG